MGESVSSAGADGVSVLSAEAARAANLALARGDLYHLPAKYSAAEIKVDTPQPMGQDHHMPSMPSTGSSAKHSATRMTRSVRVANMNENILCAPLSTASNMTLLPTTI